MKRKLVFSARYDIDSVCEDRFDERFEPERWPADFLESQESRAVLADRLVAIAKYISVTGALGMDVYTSPYSVQIRLHLDQTLYYPVQMRQLAALLQVCDDVSISEQDRMIVLSLTYAIISL